MKKHYIILSLIFLIAFALSSRAVFGLYETTVPWPMYRHDLARSGTTTSTAPNTNQTVWSWTPHYSLGIPLVVDGMVIVNDYSYLYALDETTGVKLWQSSYFSGLYGFPAVAQGRVYVGSSGGYLYCFNASDGAKLWEYQAETTSPGIRTSPVVAGGKVYFGAVNSTKGFLYALDAYTGLYKWRYTAGGPIYSSPAIDGDLLYFGCDDNKVYALNISGTLPALKWFYTTGGQVRSTPSVGDGKVYFGSYYTDHAVFAVNKITGELIWKYVLAYSYSIETSPAFSGGLVFFTAYSGAYKAYALYANASAGTYVEADPTIRFWSTTVGGNPTSPVVADGKVFFGAGDGKLYALDVTNSQVIWTYKFPTGSPAEPIVADGRIFVPHYDGVYCFGSLYPPVTYYYTVTVLGYTFVIQLVINATPSQLDTAGLLTLKKISYTLEGIPATTGMSNITIPNQMLGGPYVVTVDGGLPLYRAPDVDNGTHTSLYFTYYHSVHTVEITGTTVITEFPSAIILPLLITISLIAVTLAKKKLPKN